MSQMSSICDSIQYWSQICRFFRRRIRYSAWHDPQPARTSHIREYPCFAASPLTEVGGGVERGHGLEGRGAVGDEQRGEDGKHGVEKDWNDFCVWPIFAEPAVAMALFPIFAQPVRRTYYAAIPSVAFFFQVPLAPSYASDCPGIFENNSISSVNCVPAYGKSTNNFSTQPQRSFAAARDPRRPHRDPVHRRLCLPRSN